MSVKVVEIKKEHFVAFEKVRQGGRFNMITEANNAAAGAKLTVQQYMNVLNNYGKCMRMWPEVRQ